MHVVFHRSNCRVTLSHRSFPTPDWLKVCSSSLTHLLSWALQRRIFRDAPSTHACKICFRHAPFEFELLGLRPTSDPIEFENLVKTALKIIELPPPLGQLQPSRIEREVVQFSRDPWVHAYVLRRSAGHCERCGAPAPFLTPEGSPYLEVHHIVTLAEGGQDTINNTVALCPNCHRECHLGTRADTIADQLFQMVENKMKLSVTPLHASNFSEA
ncbi:HNH endonuclease [Verrucomicrobium sp. BvORR106]|uniref:HNH endonuclease n=1 Tax=Verrucomicrobium sp. BvORR106 TaxID=1403819 RepID=UPI0009DEF5D7